MAKAGDIVSNTIEDFNDELITGVAYYLGEKSMKPLEDALKSDDDSILNEALNSALSSFKYQVMNAVIVSVSTYATAKLVTVGGLIFTYIKGGKIIKAINNIKNKNLNKAGRVGEKILKGVVGTVAGTQDERLSIANMANNSANNMASIISKERHTQTVIQSERMKNLNKQVENSQTVVNQKYEQQRMLFNAKLKSGGWQNTTEDEKLYIAVTGYNFKTSPQKYTVDFINRLNSVADVAKDVEGNIVNQAQAFIDFITTLGYQKVK